MKTIKINNLNSELSHSLSSSSILIYDFIIYILALQNGRSEELTRMSSGFFKNRKTAARRSARVNSKQSSTSTEIKKGKPKIYCIHKSILIIASLTRFGLIIVSCGHGTYNEPETLVYSN